MPEHPRLVINTGPLIALAGYAIKPSGALFLEEKLLELERITLLEIDLWEYYSLILEGLLELCRVSQDSGSPILLT